MTMSLSPSYNSDSICVSSAIQLSISYFRSTIGKGTDSPPPHVCMCIIVFMQLAHVLLLLNVTARCMEDSANVLCRPNLVPPVL